MTDFYTIGFLLNRSSVSIGRALNAALIKGNIDLPHSQFVVLRCLYFQDGLSQLEIANLMFKDAAAIKRTIDNLEKKGFAERRQVRTLKNQVFITPAGRAVMPRVLEIAESVIKEALEDINEEEYALLRSMLNKIYLNTNKL